MTVNGHSNMIINKNSASEPGYVLIVHVNLWGFIGQYLVSRV